MITPSLDKSRSRAFALALLLWSLHGPSVMGSDDGPAPPGQPDSRHRDLHSPKKRKVAGQGVQGFGLGYHLGNGFGGKAIGVGPEGGYPFYGGPGYPHLAPCLRRIGGITPFPYFGGPGGPVPGQPNFFEQAGPLATDPPVVTIADESPGSDYGPFTGMIPYPESTFASYSSRGPGDSAEGSEARPQPRVPSSSPTNSTEEAIPGSPDARSTLGVDTVAVIDAGSARGLKVTRIQPSSAAEKAGLRLGDVVRSANGFLTEQPGHLSWVILNAASDGVIKMNVLSASDGEVRSITARKP